ncbi:MerR family transcriptional regulator [Thalassococcus sp.]|uniref:MerR family transcriptional regulator n=1 Tax=Thalassococcus sp. TaxID=1928858 RepID=UPI00257B2A6C|nr:MerR family transcriptional regulator [Thalassococcus sp.]
MSKSPDAFRTISEVAEWLDTPAHVLRFWESKFSQVKPVKRAGGRRYYRPSDMLLLGGIKQLLHNDGLTIKGAQKVLSDKGIKVVSALSQPLEADDKATPLNDAGDTPARLDGDTDQPEVEEAPFEEMSQPEPNVVPFQRTEVAAEKVVTSSEDTATPTGEDSLQPDLFGDMFADTKADDDVQVVEDDTPEEAPAALSDSTSVSEAPTSGILSLAARITKLSPTKASQIAPFVQELQSKLQHDNSSASV